MTITRPLVTEQERRAGISNAQIASRAAGAIGFVIQPIAGLVGVGAGILLLRQRRVAGRLYLSVAIVIFIGLALAGGLRWWLQPARDLAEVLRTADPAPAVRADAVKSTISASWPHWLLLQAPAQIVGGLVAGAGWAAYRSRRRATWRDDEPTEREVPVRSVERALHRLPAWPSQPVGRELAPDVRDFRVQLGVTMHGAPRPYTLSWGELLTHAYVDAPSQVGKTTLLVEVAAGLLADPAILDRGCPLVFLTLKPDPEVTSALGFLADAGGRRFHHITQDGTGSLTGSTYNPLAGKTADQVAAMVMETEAHSADGGFTEPHHRSTGERLLRFAARALLELAATDPGRWRVDFLHLARLVYPAELERESDRFSPDLAEAWKRFQGELNADRDLAHSVGGIRQRIARAAEGGARSVLAETNDGLPLGETGNTLHLGEALDAGDVVLFDLDAAADASAARLVGNLAIRDFVASIARLGKAGWHLARSGNGALITSRTGEKVYHRIGLIVVDEFSALGGTGLKDVFERSAGYGAGVILSTQEAGSLDEAGPTFRELVITNANVKAFFNQSVNAEKAADLFGTKKVLQETVQTFEDGSLLPGTNVYKSGQGNLREVEAYVVHPNLLRRLAPGQALIAIRSRAGEPPMVVRIKNVIRPAYRGREWTPPASAAPDDDLPALPTNNDPDSPDHRESGPESGAGSPAEAGPTSEAAGTAPRRRVLPPGNVTRRDDEPAELPRTVSGRGRRPRPRPAAAKPEPARQTARPAAPAWDDADEALDLDGQDWPIPARAVAADDAPAGPAWIDEAEAGDAHDDGHDDWPLPEGGSASR